jgi:hypothetical protein
MKMERSKDESFEIPRIKDWLTMREDKGKWYTVLFTSFMPGVVGVVKWRKNAPYTFVKRFVTIGDEAFTLLVLDNYEDRWIQMLNDGKTSGKYKAKYTNGGVARQDGSTRADKGWSNKGLNRFNELFNMVKKDRERQNVPFEANLMELVRSDPDVVKQKRKEKRLYPEEGEKCEGVADEFEMVAI